MYFDLGKKDEKRTRNANAFVTLADFMQNKQQTEY